MTNFFTKSTGEQIEDKNSFENSGRQEPIPAGTKLNANVLEATWEDETQYAKQHVLINWYITESGKYNGFTVKQKIHVFDAKTSKADKAKEMLMAIDSNCKGLLAKAADAGKLVIGDNGQLARALCGGSAMITVDVYEIESTNVDPATGELYPPRTGNWVRSVGPVAKKQAQEDKHIEKLADKKSPNYDAGEYDDDLPF